MWFFSEKKNINYNRLISKLERGNKYDIKDLLWQPSAIKINYLPVTTTMLHKLKRPELSASGLTVYKTIENGNYELIIFNVPWNTSKIALSPIIIERSTEKIVGIMLPFNELHGHLPRHADKLIGELGVSWVKLTFEFH